MSIAYAWPLMIWSACFAVLIRYHCYPTRGIFAAVLWPTFTFCFLAFLGRSAYTIGTAFPWNHSGGSGEDIGTGATVAVIVVWIFNLYALLSSPFLFGWMIYIVVSGLRKGYRERKPRYDFQIRT